MPTDPAGRPHSPERGARAPDRPAAVKNLAGVPITPGMDIQDQMVEHLGLDAELTAEQAARILVGAASYARDALRALDECTRPELDQVALHDLARRAGDIEMRLRVLHRVTIEACVNWPVGDIPALVEANLELAARCRALIHQRRIDVEHEVMILRAPLPAYGLPC